MEEEHSPLNISNELIEDEQMHVQNMICQLAFHLEPTTLQIIGRFNLMS